MAWSTSNYFPEWGDSGERPSDGFQYDGGDQVNEKHLDYFLNALDEFEDDVWAALEDIDSDSDGTVDDSDQYDGTAPSDGSSGQFIQTDGSNTSWQNLAFAQATRPSVDGVGRTWIRERDTDSNSYSTDTRTADGNGLAIHDDIVFVGHDDGEVSAYDYLTGNELWTHSHHSDSVLCIDSNGEYVASGDSGGNVYVANVSDGSQVSTHQLHGVGNNVHDVQLGPRSQGDSGTVYSGGEDNNVYAAAVSDGSQEWTHSQHAGNVRALVLDRGHLYSASEADGDDIVRVFADDGSLDTTITNPRSEGISDMLKEGGLLFFTFGSIANDGAGSGRVYSYDLDSSEVIWQTEVGVGAGGADYISYGDGKIYTDVGTGLYVIDVDSGQEDTLVPQSEFANGLEYHRGMVYTTMSEESRAIGWTARDAKFISDGSQWLFESLLQ